MSASGFCRGLGFDRRGVILNRTVGDGPLGNVVVSDLTRTKGARGTNALFFDQRSCISLG